MSSRIHSRGVVGPLAVAFALALAAGGARAGTTGRLAGRIADKHQQPLPGANISFVGIPLGGASGTDGRFSVLNVPAGEYSVRVSLIGYRTQLIEKLEVSADQTTTLDLALDEAPLELKEVVVTAKPAVVDVNLTSNIAKVTRQQIAKLPVQELQDVVNLQAGVVDGHIRGGRKGEVQYQVDGVTVNNVFDNESSLRLDRSLLEEVQVISGTFDAEYGQAMSGVVNAVLRRCTERFAWSGEVLQGAFAYAGTPRFLEYEFHPSEVQNYQFSMTGPTFLPKTSFLVSARRAAADDYIYGKRIFEPADTVDRKGGLHPTGDGKDVPLDQGRTWSGVLRLTHQPRSGLELDYQAIGEIEDGRRNTYVFRLNPDGLSRQRTVSLIQGLTLTHTLSKRVFYKVGVRQNYFRYRDMAYDNLYDPRYDAAGVTYSDPNDPLRRILGGVDLGRFEQSTNGAVGSGSLVAQSGPNQVFKLGGELQFPHLLFGNPGYLVYQQLGNRVVLGRQNNNPPDFPGLKRYQPLLGAFYGQDDVEWSDIRLRAGLRVEYFTARATLPSDLANPADSISGAPRSVPRNTTLKLAVMPRIGVSFPVTSRSAMSFAYGHFTQMPPLRDVFTNADYSVLAEIQAGTDLGRFGVLGNPDVKPERTVQYQFGYKQAISEDLGLDLTVFYKDIRDLLGVEFISTYNAAIYPRVTNVDFGNVTGFTISLNQRALGPFSMTIDYTWQNAQADASDPHETFTRAENLEDPRPRLVPLDWDQRHTVNLSLTMSREPDYTVGAIVRAASGQPYTPSIVSVFGGGLESNSGRKPPSFEVDLRGERRLRVGGSGLTLFGRVFNLFDTRFFNGFVFASTGSPYYTRNPNADAAQFADPTRFYGPRRIELGLSMDGTPR